MTTFHEYFIPIFGAGVTVAVIASIAAGFSRGVILPIVALIIGVLAFWAGLFLGSEIGYQKWQAIPNPPDEAFADTMPMGALIAGWVPGVCFCAFIFATSRVLKIAVVHFKRNSNEPQAKDNQTELQPTNPYRSPNDYRGS